MSFFFFRKKHSPFEAGIFQDAADVHCHILPGVDDGSPDLDTSIRLLQYLESLGYRHALLTPHTMEDVPNTPEALSRQLECLREGYKGPIGLHLASEYMLDSAFPRLLSDKKVLPWGACDRLLVETSYAYAPTDFDDMLDSVFSSGYFPVIAHPERYAYMTKRDYSELKERGCLLQLNLNSLSGYYGPMAKKNAEYILANGMYDHIGTDIHSLRQSYTRALESIRLSSKDIDALGALLRNNSQLITKKQ